MNKLKKSLKNKRGITLIALVITIIVLIILAGISISMLSGDNGILQKATDAKTRTDEAQIRERIQLAYHSALTGGQGNYTKDTLMDELENEFKTDYDVDDSDDENWKMIAHGQEVIIPAGKEIPDIVETIINEKLNTVLASTKNTKLQDMNGNSITVPAGFKIIPNGINNVSYTYAEENSESTGMPCVQDGIVISDGINEFVWVPVGTINNKNNDVRGSVTTITLGRYSDFTMTSNEIIPQPIQGIMSLTDIENIDDSNPIGVVVSGYGGGTYYEFMDDGVLAQNYQGLIARDLGSFLKSAISNSGYYIARYESSLSNDQVQSKRDAEVWRTNVQTIVANKSREMYNNNNKYSSDLINSYAWDTAIIFIQSYSGELEFATKTINSVLGNSGMNSNQYCNINDMSGNLGEYSTEVGNIGLPCSRDKRILWNGSNVSQSMGRRAANFTVGTAPGSRVVLTIY